MKAFKPRSPPEGGGAGWKAVVVNTCLNMWLDSTKRRIKRVLANQNYVDKFYPHSILTFYLQLATAYKFEIDKFARTWCDSGLPNLFSEIVVIKEIFEVENKDNIVWVMELLSNGHAIENLDRLMYLLLVAKR
jgi:hypothetical protein